MKQGEKAQASAARAPLTQSSIVAAAVTIADAEGSAALTMRNIADQLGFKVMALYNHVANKDELLRLMLESIADEIADPDPDLEPLAAVRAVAMGMRSAFVGHPWAPDLWMRHLPGPRRIHVMETLLRTLGETGLSDEVAHHGFHAVNNHVIGYSLQELTMPSGTAEMSEALATFSDQVSTGEFPHTEEHVQYHLDGNATSSFELVLDLILDGLVRLDAE